MQTEDFFSSLTLSPNCPICLKFGWLVSLHFFQNSSPGPKNQNFCKTKKAPQVFGQRTSVQSLSQIRSFLKFVGCPKVLASFWLKTRPKAKIFDIRTDKHIQTLSDSSYEINSRSFPGDLLFSRSRFPGASKSNEHPVK